VFLEINEVDGDVERFEFGGEGGGCMSDGRISLWKLRKGELVR